MPKWKFLPGANLNGDFELVDGVIDYASLSVNGDRIRWFEDFGFEVHSFTAFGNIRTSTSGGFLDVTGGTITRISAAPFGDTYLSGTGLNFKAARFYDLVNNPLTTPEKFLSVLMGGNDQITGTAFTLGQETLRGYGGKDTIKAKAGNDIVFGGKGDDKLFGDDGNDNMQGEDGADTLTGGSGGDLLSGGRGDDRFVFNKALGPTNIDTISDFSPGNDRIALDEDIFRGLDRGRLDADAFVVGAAATTGDHRIIYSSGTLYYDADGVGTGAQAIQFATLTGAPALGAGDILIIA